MSAPEVMLGGGPVATVHYLPVPVRVTVCEPPAALSVIVSVPRRAPTLLGRKATEILQDFPGIHFLAAIVGFAEVPTRRNAGNIERAGARIGEIQEVYVASCAHQLRAKAHRGGGKAHHRGRARAGDGDLMRAAHGAVGD